MKFLQMINYSIINNDINDLIEAFLTKTNNRLNKQYFLIQKWYNIYTRESDYFEIFCCI